MLELQGDLLNSNGRDRTEGFEACMKQRYPAIEVIARPTRWEQTRAADATQTLLTVHPDLGAIYLESGSIMLPGVLSVLHQAHRAPGKIFLVAIDGSPYELDKIRSGDLDATISQPLNLYASARRRVLEARGEGRALRRRPHHTRQSNRQERCRESRRSGARAGRDRAERGRFDSLGQHGRIAMTASAPIVRGANLSKAFGATPALRDVSVEVNTGEIRALVGRNGAGKSTLVSVLTGMHEPDAGTIHFSRIMPPPPCRGPRALAAQCRLCLSTPQDHPKL